MPGRFTDHQADQLQLLLELGAISDVTAVPALGLGRERQINAHTIGVVLAPAGLVAKHVRKAKGGSRATHYWLLPAGIKEAEQLAKDGQKGERANIEGLIQGFRDHFEVEAGRFSGSLEAYQFAASGKRAGVYGMMVVAAARLIAEDIGAIKACEFLHAQGLQLLADVGPGEDLAGLPATAMLEWDGR